MRRFLQHHRWATVLVACLLLFATSGLSLSRMTCLMSGRSVLIFGQADDRCPDGHAQQGTTLNAACCDLSQAKLESAQLLASASLNLNMALVALEGAPMVVAVVIDVLPLRWLQSRSPPIQVTDRLAAMQQYLI